MLILDTNVLSAIMKLADNPAIHPWLRRTDPSLLCITTFTVFEVRFGINRPLVTRNISDFDDPPLTIINPWA